MTSNTKAGEGDPPITGFVCGKRWCQDVGQEHDWTGPVIQFDPHGAGSGEAVTCARCGLDAMTDSLMRLQ